MGKPIGKLNAACKELEREGWNVRPTVHVITVGVRAPVPIRYVEVLKSLGIKEMNPAQRKSKPA
jgi:hypothetical protein